jgi:streptogramin lyase
MGRPPGRLLLLILLAAPARAIVLEPGDFVVLDTNAKEFVRVDADTGRREKIAAWTAHGPKHMSFPWDLAVASDHRIFVADMNARAIFAIDPETGSMAIVSGRGTGSGPEFGGPRGIALDGAGGAYMVDIDRRPGKVFVHRIFHVALATGDHRVVSGGGVGSGPPLDFPHDMAIERGGTLLVNVKPRSALYRVDPQSGDRSVVSSPEVGSGPDLGRPFGIAILRDGDAVTTDRRNGVVLRVDTETGDRRILASGTIGKGPPIRTPFGVVQGSDGDLYVVDLRVWGIYRMDPETGEHSMFSSKEVGEGKPFRLPRNLALVPGPVSKRDSPRRLAPALLAIAAAGAVLALWARRRSRPSRPGDAQAAP